MKIGIAGLWHLGIVYAVGLAELGHKVSAYDPDPVAISNFKRGKLRVFEPGLEELLDKNIKNGNLQFTESENELQDVKLFILAYDSPVDENDKADYDFVLSEFKRLAKNLGTQTTVMISSQMPVGTSDKIEEILQSYELKSEVVVHPENLRLGKAVESFFNPGRIVVGTADGAPNSLVSETFEKLESPILWMHRKSAELTKHSLNAFLATCVTFMGEIAEISEQVGADAKEVEAGLKSDSRIGNKAYLSPGLGFAGGTLARDVRKLAELQVGRGNDATILSSIMVSNQYNNGWILRTLKKVTETLPEVKICFWGVSYVENTNTLRRSEIYNVMTDFARKNAEVSFVENFPIIEEMDNRITCKETPLESITNINVLVVSKKLKALSNNDDVLERLLNKEMWILDPSRALANLDSRFEASPKWLTVGKGI